MAIDQQVNVQDLQRLNDAILVCMDAIRRVVPQMPGYGYGYGYGMGPQTPGWGTYGLDPVTLQIAHQIRTANVYGNFPYQTQGFGQIPYGFQPSFGLPTPFGFQPPVGLPAPYAMQTPYAHGFGGVGSIPTWQTQSQVNPLLWQTHAVNPLVPSSVRF